jgi:hypothetical protein
MNAILRILTMVSIVMVLSPLAGYADGSHGGGYYRGGGGYYRGGGGYYGGGGGYYRGGGGGVWITPGWGPWWGGYYPYYYAVPPVVVERPSVEYYYQQAPQQAPQQEEEPVYWYYCKNPEGYYPYVQSCPDGWMKVVPKAPTLNKEK